MPIEGFDYKAFAADLAKQALEILVQPGPASPTDLTDKDKKYIVETIRKFCYMAGEALSNDAQSGFNKDQASIITQFIGEWTFHKSIDLIKSKVPDQFREPILQIIAANIFNTAKIAITKQMPDEQIISLVEEKVKKVYNEELKKLADKGALSPQQLDVAMNTSNINDMVQKSESAAAAAVNDQSQIRTSTNPDKKVLKFAALSILLKNLPQDKSQEILNSLPVEDMNHVVNYMKMSNLEDKIDHSVIISTLEEIKNIIPVTEEMKTAKMLKNYYLRIKSAPPDKLSKIAMKERESVKEFIFDETFPAQNIFSNHVLKSLIKNIENKLNDN